MKISSYAFTLMMAVVTCCVQPAAAADTNAASTELSALVAKVKDRLQDGKRTEAELAAELKELDVLIEKHKGDKSDAAAEITLMKAILYVEVLEKSDEGLKLVQQVKQDYPDTKAGKNADLVLKGLQQQIQAKALQGSLVEGARFPDFDEKDIAGNPISVAKFKGKVVLVDFWATWCAPCVFELSNVQKVYEKYHEKGLEIIGVSLDQSQDKLKNFTKDKNVPWAQFCDGKGWENKLAQKYGIQSIPATFLLDGEGKIIAKNLRGDDLDQAVAKALPKN
jgi:peroxiredoxin